MAEIQIPFKAYAGEEPYIFVTSNLTPKDLSICDASIKRASME